MGRRGRARRGGRRRRRTRVPEPLRPLPLLPDRGSTGCATSRAATAGRCRCSSRRTGGAGWGERVYLSPYSMRVPRARRPRSRGWPCSPARCSATASAGRRSSAGAGVGEVVVVLGCGPQGRRCVVAAIEAGAGAVVAVGRATSGRRMESASALGATATARTDVDDPVKAILDAAGGVEADLVIDTTGATDALALATRVVRKGGRVVVAGQSAARDPARAGRPHGRARDRRGRRQQPRHAGGGAGARDPAVRPLPVRGDDHPPAAARAGAPRRRVRIGDPSAQAVKVLVDPA